MGVEFLEGCSTGAGREAFIKVSGRTWDVFWPAWLPCAYCPCQIILTVLTWCGFPVQNPCSFPDNILLCHVSAVPFFLEFQPADVKGSGGLGSWHWVWESSWSPAPAGRDRARPFLPFQGFGAGRPSCWATLGRICCMCRSGLGWLMNTAVAESIWHR